MVYNKTKFDLKILLNEVIEELKPNIINSGLELKTDIKEDQYYFVNADREKIKQVIGNIVDNSIKYTKKGFICISLYEEKGEYKISVKDSGVGINPKEIDKLFTKFSRTKDASRVNVIGTGLGLYIGKKMIIAHGGDIEVRSEGVDKGAEFIIKLRINL